MPNILKKDCVHNINERKCQLSVLNSIADNFSVSGLNDCFLLQSAKTFGPGRMYYSS